MLRSMDGWFVIRVFPHVFPGQSNWIQGKVRVLHASDCAVTSSQLHEVAQDFGRPWGLVSSKMNRSSFFTPFLPNCSALRPVHPGFADVK